MEKNQYEKIALEIANLTYAKNEAYGDSLSKMAQILELLYGDSIPKERYEELHYIIRLLDKVSRIASGNKDAFEEDPFKDIMGYSLNKLAHQQNGHKILESLVQISSIDPAAWRGVTIKKEPIYIRYRHGILSIWINKSTDAFTDITGVEKTIFSKQIGNNSEMTTKQLLFWLEQYNLFKIQND